MNRKIIILFVLWFCSIAALASELKGEMCFESYGLVAYFELSSDPVFISEVEAKAHSWAYHTHQIVITAKKRDSNGYTNFSFIGHGRNRAGDEAAMNGTGYKKGNKWHFEYKSNLFQQSTGDKGEYGIYSTYEVNGIWDFNENQLNAGRAVHFNDVTNSNLTNPTYANNINNDYDIGVVNKISCKLY